MRLPDAIVLLAFVPVVSAQSPFQFREAVLLEQKLYHSGETYSAGHSQIFGRQGPSPADQMIPDAANVHVYATAQWLGLLAETDAYRHNGALDVAEKQYIDILAKLRQAQGLNGIDVGWMLDHLGEFYLEIRDFEKAYPNFAEAIYLRRANIETFGKIPQQAAVVTTCLCHLVKLLTEVGRLDSAKGDLAAADRELAEAVQIGNAHARLDLGLDAVYFLSQVLEKQAKWAEAETLWSEAVKARDKMTQSTPYWDALKEQAAFYARHGDFRTAATIAKRVQTETAGKQLRPSVPIPDSLDQRMGLNTSDRWPFLYKPASDLAMSEIIALDDWMVSGAVSAAPLFTARSLDDISFEEQYLFGRGSGPQQARFLAFLTQRAFLHMSVLLDGQPSAALIVKAYEDLEPIKGRYLAALAETTRLGESDRNNPHVSGATAPVILDELAAERARHAHLFVSAALDGKTFSDVAFASSEQAEQAAAEGLAYNKRLAMGGFPVEDPSPNVPPDAAFIDITAWERASRAANTAPHREYGAFIFRKNQPPKFVKLATAADIDRDVDALETVVVGPHVRGIRTNPSQAAAPEQTNQRLQRLYQEVIAPMEPALAGVSKLFIVPDGKLTLAPIEAFIDSQGKYLLQRYTVTYFDSYRALFGPPDDNSRHEAGLDKTTPPIVVANPDFNALLPNTAGSQAVPNRPQFETLPGAELEARDVRQALHIPADRLLTGKSAREEQLRSIGGPEILHFATHTVPSLEWKIPVASYDLFEYPRPSSIDAALLQAFIALSGANRPQAGPEDGILTGLEVASLRLTGTKLVVLSTCEAGQGTPVDGQGVLGLRGAFTIAGAEGLVMSLWPVDDRAGRLFMQFFYAHLDAGPAEAVRLAQLDLVAKTEYKQPRFWAGYSYSGFPTTALKKRDATSPATPTVGPTESLATPTCFEITTRQSNDPSYVLQSTYRVKIGGSVRKALASPDRVTYDLLPPSSDLEESSSASMSGSPFVRDPGVKLASHSQFPVSLTIERTPDQSSVSFREYVADGDQRYKPQTILQITLKGPPALFPSFDIPVTLPALPAYTEAIFARGPDIKASEKVTSVAACK